MPTTKVFLRPTTRSFLKLAQNKLGGRYWFKDVNNQCNNITIHNAQSQKNVKWQFIQRRVSWRKTFCFHNRFEACDISSPSNLNLKTISTLTTTPRLVIVKYIIPWHSVKKRNQFSSYWFSIQWKLASMFLTIGDTLKYSRWKPFWNPLWFSPFFDTHLILKNTCC